MTTTDTQMTKKGVTNIVGLMIALLVAIFAFQLNASMLSPALNTMANKLTNGNVTPINLTQTIFFTAAALFSLFLPRLADLAGRKKILLGMLGLTAIGCIISALATNIPILMIGRICQGASGPVVPLCLIMLHVKVTEEKRYAKLMAVLTSINGGIAGVDALLGGWLASISWQAVFWAMAIICVIAVVLVVVAGEESKAKETPRMDWLGVILLVIAIGVILPALNGLPDAFGTKPLGLPTWAFALIGLVIAVISFMAFWRVENRGKHPMVPTAYLKQRRSWGLLLTTTLTMTGVFAVMNGFIPNIAQNTHVGLGLAADKVSFATLTPYAIAGLVFGIISGQLAAKFGLNKILRIGLIGTVVGLVLALIGVAVPSVWLFVVINVFIGITYAGMTNIMLNGLGIVLSPADNQGYLPGLNAGAFNLGAGLSFAILSAVPTMMGLSVATDATTYHGFTAAIVAALVLVALAFAASFLIPHPKTLTDTVDAQAAGKSE